MVTKGLDFAGVQVVGILNADTLINFPDFRSSERAFDMMMQVAGRAGRRSGKGIVAVQTYQPEHPLIQHLIAHDYSGFYDMELADRQRYTYPPFSRLIYIYLKHRDERTLETIASTYGQKLRELFGNRVYGPEEPTVSRIQLLYIRKLMLKVEANASMKKVKEILRELFEYMHSMPAMKGTTIYYDVDPM
jgi:primosomal protein N' (replication factor Y)